MELARFGEDPEGAKPLLGHIYRRLRHCIQIRIGRALEAGSACEVGTATSRLRGGMLANSSTNRGTKICKENCQVSTSAGSRPLDPTLCIPHQQISWLHSRDSRIACVILCSLAQAHLQDSSREVWAQIGAHVGCHPEPCPGHQHVLRGLCPFCTCLPVRGRIIRESRIASRMQ